MAKQKKSSDKKVNIKKSGKKQPGKKPQNEKPEPWSEKWFQQFTTHPELEEFKNIQTAFWPHPKPVTVSEQLMKEVIAKKIFLSANTILGPSKEADMSGKLIDGTSTVIAILDTGVYDEHIDLAKKVLLKTNYRGHTGEGEDVTDLHGHGTHLAGIVAGTQRNSFIGGVAPGAKIVSVKVTDNRADHTSWWKIADGLEQVIRYNTIAKEKDKVTAVLVCFNAFENVSKDLPAGHHRLCKLIDKLYHHDIPVIVSAGNAFDYFPREGLSYPAHTHNVIACGATFNYNDPYTRMSPLNLTEFTQRVNIDNRTFQNFFICAPGKDTLSCGIGAPNAYKKLSGSCQAAAAVAGVILLMQQKFRERMGILPPVKKLQDCLARNCDAIENPGERASSPSFGNKYRRLNKVRSIRNII